jgi:hypothetical protein
MFKSLLLAMIVFSLFLIGCGYFLFETNLFDSKIIERISDVFGGVFALVVTIYFFPVLLTFFVSFFIEEIAFEIEKIHYQDLKNPREIPFMENLSCAVRFGFKAFFINIFALFFMIIPVIGVLFYYIINGLLVSREYFQIISLRRIKDKEVMRLYKKRSKKYILAGIFVVFLMTLPIINIFAPIIATSMFVHLSKEDISSHISTNS